jgi:hypothetical protein
MDSLINLYLDGVKMSVFPPTIMNPNGIVASSVKYSPGARWLENIPNSIRPYNTNPQGLSTFQSTYQFLIGSILNQNGTTDTATSTEGSSDPGFGKTPQALQMQQARENTRDNWDRFMMEQAVEELYDGFVNLIAQKQPKPIQLDLFEQEIGQLLDIHPDVQDILEISDSGEYAKITIGKKEIGDTTYKYYIDANSTLRKDDAQQSEALTNLLVAVTKIPGLSQELAKNNLKYNIGEHMKRIFATSGVEGYDKIILAMTEQDMMEAQQPQGNPNQPEQMAGGQGGDTAAPTIAETQPEGGQMTPEQMQMMMQQQMQQQAPQEGMPQQMPQDMQQPEQPQGIPEAMQMANEIQDPNIRDIANQMFGGQ